MRGKPGYRAYGFFCKRITPAGAGKTCTKRQFGQLRKDHPRRCGENGEREYNVGYFHASPPQVRGKRIESANVPPYDRITPAGAGKTNCPARRARLAVDHPRRCGENMIPPCRLCVNTGSPPQVRGKRDTDGQTADVTGITPAGAGKTATAQIDFAAFKDHPLRCGENCRRTVLVESCQGSPPQVRGKLFIMLLVSYTSRITPAGAGKTNTLYYPSILI